MIFFALGDENDIMTKPKSMSKPKPKSMFAFERLEGTKNYFSGFGTGFHFSLHFSFFAVPQSPTFFCCLASATAVHSPKITGKNHMMLS